MIVVLELINILIYNNYLVVCSFKRLIFLFILFVNKGIQLRIISYGDDDDERYICDSDDCNVIVM